MTIASSGSARSAHAFPAPFIRPEVGAKIAALLSRGESVLVTGHHGAGKSTYVNAAIALIEDSQANVKTVFVGPTSACSPGALRADIARAEHAIIFIDKPNRLDEQTLASIGEAVLGNGAQVLVETTSRAALPSALRAIFADARHSTIVIPPMSTDEFHDRLTDLLGGPIPNEISGYFWGATGGNQELSQLLVNALLERGEISLGEYAWTWTGSVNAALDQIPARVVWHVERQFNSLLPEQQRFLERLALCGSIGVEEGSRLISDDLLEPLQDGGFTRSAMRRDGAVVTQLNSPLFGWVIESRVLPGFRDEVFRDLPAPVRGRDEPMSTLAWLRLAMRAGSALTAEQIILGNEAAFTLHEWAVIEQGAHIMIPADSTELETVEMIVDAGDDARPHLVLLVLQRGLSYVFRDLHDRARTDARIVRAVLDQAPHGLAKATTQLMMLKKFTYQVETDDGTIDAVFEREILRARARDDDALVEAFEMGRLSKLNEDVMHRVPLAELELLLSERLGTSPFVVALVPHAVIRLAYAGRFSDAVALAEKALQLSEFRITNLTEHVNSFVFAELVIMRAYVYLLLGDAEAAVALPNEAVARTILDPPSHEMIVGAAHMVRGRWDLALSSLRAALQRLTNLDHNRTLKLALAMYAQACAAIGDARRATVAIRRFDEMSSGPNSIHESEQEYRVLTARIAVQQKDSFTRIDAYLEKFAAAGEWFAVLRTAHLGAVASEGPVRDEYLRVLEHAASKVDHDVADAFVRDAAAIRAADIAHLSGTRAELAKRGVWVPQRSTPIALSRRQREIAGLVVSGLPNRDIAERLHLSVRTVESHVATVLEKTGVSDRRLLAARLAEIG